MEKARYNHLTSSYKWKTGREVSSELVDNADCLADIIRIQSIRSSAMEDNQKLVELREITSRLLSESKEVLDTLIPGTNKYKALNEIIMEVEGTLPLDDFCKLFASYINLKNYVATPRR